MATRIYGTVYDRDTRAVYEGATVRAYDPNTDTYEGDTLSDASGIFKISGLSDRNWEGRVTAGGPTNPLVELQSELLYPKSLLNVGQLDDRYFREDEFLNVSAGAGDAGKPIKLDAGGHVDATMLNGADLAITDLSDVAAKSGSGTTVIMQGTPTLTTPTILDLSNMGHDHEDAAGGTQLDHGLAHTGLGDDDHTQYTLADATRDFTAAPGIDFEGTVKSDVDFLTITNQANAADMDGTGTSLLFRQYYYDAGSPAAVDAVRVIARTLSTDWTSTPATQDAELTIYTRKDGVMSQRARFTSVDARFFSHVRLWGDNETSPTMNMYCYSNTATHMPTFTWRRHRGTLDTPLALQSGDRLGSLQFRGYDGSALQWRGEIRALVDGAVSSGVVPTSLSFQTGSSGLTERLLIDSDGDTHFKGATFFEDDVSFGGDGVFSTDKALYCRSATSGGVIQSLAADTMKVEAVATVGTNAELSLMAGNAGTFLRGKGDGTIAFRGGPLYGGAGSWTISNYVGNRVLDADSTTLDELADVVCTIIETLQSFTLFD